MVTGVSGSVGQGIIQGLRESAYAHQYWILGTDISRYPLCAGYSMCNKGVQVPYANDPSFIPAVKEVIKNNGIEYVLIGVDAEVLPYAMHRDEIEKETGCRIVVSDLELVSTATDKYLTYLYLEKIGLNCPETWLVLPLPSCKFPVVAKPRTGHGSVGIIVVNSYEELINNRQIQSGNIDYCFQEYLDGDEYTCGLLFDQDHDLTDSIIMKRRLICGTTVEATVVENQDIQDMIDKFAASTKALGSINIQIKMKGALCGDLGVPYIHEINPRFSGTTKMRIKAGYNDAARLVDNLALGVKIRKADTRKVHLFRYCEAAVVEC